MFGNLVVWYLFLGGLSGGATLAALAAHCLANRRGGAWRTFDRALYRPLLCIALAALVLGCVCLLGDLRRPRAAHLLFISPTLNVMNVGALLLVVLVALLLVLVATAEQRGPALLARSVDRAVRVSAVVAACAVIAYTGLYLYTFRAVLPWTSPLIVVLFVLSALSCGVGALYACVPFARPNAGAHHRELAVFERADLVVIALEAVALAALLVQQLFSAGALGFPGLLQALNVAGLAAPFFAGFLGCGLVVPVVVALVGRRVRLNVEVRCALLAASLLVGGFFLRYCVINVPLAYKAFMLAGM